MQRFCTKFDSVITRCDSTTQQRGRSPVRTRKLAIVNCRLKASTSSACSPDSSSSTLRVFHSLRHLPSVEAWLTYLNFS